MAIEINLLPQKQQTFFSQERLLTYSKIGAIVSIIFTVCSALAIFLLNRDQTLVNLRAKENTIIAQLTLLHDKTAKNLIILDRSNRIASIVKGRGNLDDKVAQLQKLLPLGSTITAFSVTTQDFSLTISSPSLSSLGGMVDNLVALIQKKQFVKTVTIQGLVSDEKGGVYLLTVSGTLL